MTDATLQLDRIEQWQSQHGKDDERRFGEVSEDIGEIKDDVRIIKENHLAHIQESTTTLSNDMKWVKKIQWGQLAGIGMIAVGILTALLLKLI